MSVIDHRSFEPGGLVRFFERHNGTHDILSVSDIAEIPESKDVLLVGCDDEGTQGHTIYYYAVPKGRVIK